MRSRIVVFVVLAWWLGPVGLAAAAAPRPPLPAGAVQLAPGHVPSVCTAGAFNAYGSNFGVYWSPRSKAWVSAPSCYPKWGYLGASASQAVPAGKAVTVTAIPDSGSNSAEYAPLTNSISWQFPGTRVAGCGTADLSCTAIPAKKATKEWQWGEFHVSMPRTFFINSPGSNCAGQPICGGVSTQAWAWAGVPPKGTELPQPVSGRVVRGCSGSSCAASPEPVRGARLVARSGGKTKRVTADASGAFEFKLKPGTWKIEAVTQGVAFSPAQRSVRVSKSPVSNVEFRGCPRGVSGSGSSAPLATASQGSQGVGDLVGVSTCKVGKSTVVSTVSLRYSSTRQKVLSARWWGAAWCSDGARDAVAQFDRRTLPSLPITSTPGPSGVKFHAGFSSLGEGGTDFTGQLIGTVKNANSGVVELGNMTFRRDGATCQHGMDNLQLRPSI